MTLEVLVYLLIYLAGIPLFYLLYMKLMCWRLRWKRPTPLREPDLRRISFGMIFVTLLWPFFPAVAAGLVLGDLIGKAAIRLQQVETFSAYITKKILECAKR
jgi:hypothetical protein